MKELAIPAHRLALVAGLLSLFVAACAGAGPTQPPATSTPGPTTAPTATPATTDGVTPTPAPTPTLPPDGVTSPAQAAALVLASDPRFIGVSPLHPDMFGQCCWYEVVDAADGYRVTVVLGWGDCMAGCTDEHRWHLAVDRAGSISLLGEEGSTPVPAPEPVVGQANLTVVMQSGPTCPVETNPPDPACAPRPVANGEVIIRDAAGTELARGLTNQDGILRMQVPAGAYVVEPQPFEGLLGTPAAVAFSANGGGEAMLQFDYDTGIR